MKFDNDKLKEGELKRFSKETEWQKLPKIHGHWMQKFMLPKFRTVFNVNTILKFYALGLTKGREKSDELRILSLGSGLCIVEQNIALELRKQGYTNFHIECLEMSPERCAVAHDRFIEKGLMEIISVKEQDLQEWTPKDLYTSIMANHSLHHFQALEHIFTNISNSLDSDGLFVINDMIGRNGHQRWPEVLAYMESIWATLPRKFKYNHPYKRFDDEFDNWDYSRANFEGIRAQDILPLLNQNFRATHFVAEGGIPDVFVDRKYGHNFDIDSDDDKRLIEQIGFMNSVLIDTGAIKPTMMLAWFGQKNSVTSDKQKFYRHWSSNFCERTVPI